MKHWYSIKQQHSDCLIAYRMGDFYEFFYDDAVKVSKILGITLTARGKPPNNVPLAGVPHHAISGYLTTLVRANQRVCIVEQLEDPKQATGTIVKRGVVQILSPGSIIEGEMLDHNRSNYIASLVQDGRAWGVALLEVSCGDFYATEYRGTHAWDQVLSLLTRHAPSECVMPEQLASNQDLFQQLRTTIETVTQPYVDWAFGYDTARAKLLDLFHVASLDGFGIEGKILAITAAGALTQYLTEMHTNPLAQNDHPLANVKKIRPIVSGEIMELDAPTLKNLEILRNLRDGTPQGTLLQVFDRCRTPMGARLLRQWLIQPLIDPGQIKNRLGMVDFFFKNTLIRTDFLDLLKIMGDVERLISRINFSTKANGRHLVSLRNSLKLLPDIKDILGKEVSPLIAAKIASLDDFSELCTLVDVTIVESPPITITDGGIIAAGYNAEVDELKNILQHGQDWILQYEEKVKQKLGKKIGIKVSYNNQIGYFLQITQKTLQEIGTMPEEFVQKSTLTNAARFITEELKEMEEKLLHADTKVKDLEYKLFNEIRQKVAGYTQRVQVAAEIIADLDVLATFGHVASDRNYCLPEINSDPIINIKDGRHPVVECFETTEPFVPNDTNLNTTDTQIMLVTGPNMSGKSTYLRQVALIVLLAQVGSFVPAKSAQIGIVDRIFTRIGAADDLTRRQSTFMVEMMETAQILNNASSRSLIIIDELGRGTSTTDGLSIAHAVLENIHNIGAKTLFSTHYHQLTEIDLPRLKNFHLAIKEHGKDLLFLRKLVAGGTDKSYGIHVAGLAGIPPAVIERANRLLELIEDEKLYQVLSVNTAKLSGKENNHSPNEKSEEKSASKLVQTILFKPKPTKSAEILETLRKLDLNQITPMEAMRKLAELQEECKKIT